MRLYGIIRGLPANPPTELRSELQIDAPPDSVWRVLTSFVEYPDWNPFIKRVNGKLELGAKLSVTFTPLEGNQKTVTATVTRLSEGRELGFSDKLWFKGWFDGEYFVQLSAVGERATRVISGANYAGWLVQRMGNTLTQTARGLVGMNQALKKRVERTPR